jgi:hypothetical protein
MKGLIAVGVVIIGVGWAYLLSAVFALIGAFVLGFLLDPFLAILDAQRLTERFSGLSFADRFILIFTARLIIGGLTPASGYWEWRR